MPRDEDDVSDFEVAAEPREVDEVLPEPPRRELPGTSGQRRSLAVALVVLAVLGLGVRAATSRDRHAAAAVGSATPTSSATPRGLSPTWEVDAPEPGASHIVIGLPHGGGLVHVPGVIVTEEAAGRCPTQDIALTCVMSTEVSTAFREAVAAAFPGARQTSARTVATGGTGDSGHALHYARMTARVGKVEILVLVQQAPGGTGPQLSSDDGRRMVLYRTHRVDGYNVQIEVAAPSGRGPSSRVIDRLAADPRLLTSP